MDKLFLFTIIYSGHPRNPLYSVYVTHRQLTGDFPVMCDDDLQLCNTSSHQCWELFQECAANVLMTY